MRLRLRRPEPAPETEARPEERLAALAGAIADAQSDRAVLAAEREEIVAAQEALPDLFADARLGRVPEEEVEAHRDELASRAEHLDAELARLDGEVAIMRRRAADLCNEIAAAAAAAVEERARAARVLVAEAAAELQRRWATVRKFEAELADVKERGRFASARFDERVAAAAERVARQERETAASLALMPAWRREHLSGRMAALVDEELARLRRREDDHIRTVLRQDPAAFRARKAADDRRREPRPLAVTAVDFEAEAEA